MMKAKFIYLFLLFYAALSFSCQSSSLASLNNDANENKFTVAGNSNSQPKIEINVGNKTQPKTDSFFVILGSASVNKDKIELDGDFWGHSIEEDITGNSGKDEIEIDLMNCAGYIASATTTYRGTMREVKLIKKSTATDAVQKIKQCSTVNNGEIFISDVFGITPREDKRKNIKIGKIDTKKIYDALAKDIKQIKKIKNPEGETTPQLKGTKGNLLLGDDNWTDLNGDGQIDLIEFHDTPCDEKDTCTWIFQLIDGKWKDIDYIFPL